MKWMVSFTSTILGFISGKVTAEDVSEGWLRFSCSRVHVLDLPDGNVPFEATWGNPHGTLDHVHEGYDDVGSVPVDKVAPENIGKVNHFLALVDQADAEGRVEWGAGNQPDFLEKLSARPEDQVFWHNSWRKCSEYSPLDQVV